MTKSELRNLIKSHFSLIDAPKAEETVVEENFASVTLIDGTEVSNNQEGDFEVGQEVYVKDEAGNWVLAPEGSHDSESGITLVVDAEGRLVEVHHPDQAEAEMEEVKPEETIEMAEEEIAEDVVETAIEEGLTPDEVIEAVKTVIEEVVQPQIEELKKEVMAYKEKMEKVSAEPASESKTATSKFAKTSILNAEPAHNKSRYEMALQTLNNKRKK